MNLHDLVKVRGVLNASGNPFLPRGGLRRVLAPDCVVTEHRTLLLREVEEKKVKRLVAAGAKERATLDEYWSILVARHASHSHNRGV